MRQDGFSSRRKTRATRHDDGRLLLGADERGHAHVGRVAVLAEQRRRAYGRAIMAHLHELAGERGFTRISPAAQLHAIPFYQRLGYVARGDVFLEAIQHCWMDLDLRPDAASSANRLLE